MSFIFKPSKKQIDFMNIPLNVEIRMTGLDNMIENEEDQIYSELSQENVNKERERLVECKHCKRTISTWMRAPKCMICHSEMISVVITNV